jgi:hypothetical protein
VKLARRTGRFPQLVDSKSCLNIAFLADSPGFRDRTLAIALRQSLIRHSLTSWAIALGIEPLPSGSASMKICASRTYERVVGLTVQGSE